MKKPSPRRVQIGDSIKAQMSGSIFSLMMQNSQSGFVAVFLIALLGNATFEVGVVTFLFQTMFVARVFVSPYVDTIRPQPFLVRWAMVSAVLSFGIAFMPYLAEVVSPQLCAWLFIAMIALYGLILNTFVCAWFPVLQYIVPSRIRGRYFGVMRASWRLTSVVALIIAGLILGDDPEPKTFMWILVPASLFQFLRVYFYRRLPDPPVPQEAKARTDGYLKSMIKPLFDRPFRFFVTFLTLHALVMGCTIPFFVPYIRNTIGCPADVTIYCGAAMSIGGILSLRLWGRVVDKYGIRIVFIVSLMLFVLGDILLFMTPTYATSSTAATVMALGSILMLGLSTSGFGIATTIRLYDHAPESENATYMAYNTATVGIVSGTGALIMGAVLKNAPATLNLAWEFPTFKWVLIVKVVLTLMLMALVPRLPRYSEPHLRELAKAVFRTIPSPFELFKGGRP